MKTAPRYPIEFPATVIRSGKKGRARIQAAASSANLSLTGLGLEFAGECPFSMGDTVRVVIQLGDASDAPVIRELKMEAKVVWVGGARCGLEIAKMAESSKRFYESLVAGYHTLFECSLARASKVSSAA